MLQFARPECRAAGGGRLQAAERSPAAARHCEVLGPVHSAVRPYTADRNACSPRCNNTRPGTLREGLATRIKAAVMVLSLLAAGKIGTQEYLFRSGTRMC
jgi:hypothetical protein